MMKITISALVVGLLASVAYGQEKGTVAFYRNEMRNSSYSSGIVQVYYDGGWQGICNDDSFGEDEADVICHQLGYTGSESFNTAGMRTGYGSIEVVNYTVNCANNEYQTLFQCDLVVGADCDPDDAVTVQCLTTRLWDDPFDGQVRLQNGLYTSQGVVEVYCNDAWGTVCSQSGFGTEEADLVCQQLGYTDGTTSDVARNASQPVWLTNVNCFSSYNCLTSCQSCPASDMASSCTSDNVAYARCRTSIDNNNTNTLGSCDFTDLAAAIGRLIGIIVGVIIACCVISVFLALLPFCICCCLGVGIGAAAAKA